MTARERLAVAALGALALGLAWQARFVLDDAFISFQYARSWVEGQGLTWFGERVEGYTNFGWVVWVALGLRLGADPVVWSQATGGGAFVVATFLLWRIARSASPRDTWVAAVAALGFVTNFSVHSFATGGLATMFQTALVLGAFRWLQVARFDGGESLRPLWAASLCAALALLVRLDSAVLLLPLGGWAWLALRQQAPERRSGAAVALSVPLLLLVGGWFVWKVGYYGAWLPNSFAAKVSGTRFAWDGSLQWWRFLLWYSLAPSALFLGGVAWARRVRPTRTEVEVLLVAAGTLTASFLYLTAVGGDFMEFRFLVPAAPAAYLVVGLSFGLAFREMGWGWRAILAVDLLGLLVASSARHAATYETDPDLRMDGVWQLGDFYGLYPDGEWDRIGSALAREFADADPVLATNAAGAIPYYSRLVSVDLWGLNDATIPRLGLVSGYRRPGHHFRAPFSYLSERRVNLIVGSPTLASASQFDAIDDMGGFLREWARRATEAQTSGPRWIDVVAMPVDGETRLLVWVFESTPAIERVVRGWPRWRVPYRVPERRDGLQAP